MLPGTRIPAVFVNNEGYIGVRSQVGDDANFAKNINIDAKTWIEVVIKQYADDGKVFLHYCYKINQAQNMEILNHISLCSGELMPPALVGLCG